MRILPATALILMATAGHAQQPAASPACATVRVAMPAELSAWSQQKPVAAGTEPGGGATIQAGQAVRVSLQPAEHLKLAPAPKTVGPNGGTLTLVITAPGTYRLALGERAWVDLVRAGRVIPSSAHDNGPKCSEVRKIVDFVLTPGQYVVQLSGSEAESLVFLAAKVA